MKNKATIKGDGNFVLQGNKDLKINNETKKDSSSKKNRIGIIGVFIAIITLIVTIIVGWNNIINFFIK